MTVKLEREEQKVLESFEAGEWSSAPDREAVLSRILGASWRQIEEDGGLSHEELWRRAAAQDR